MTLTPFIIIFVNLLSIIISSNTSEEIQVQEELRSGDVIGSIDPHRYFDNVGKFPSKNVSFGVLHSTDTQHRIKVDPRTGQIRANSRIDRDTMCPGEENCFISFDVDIRVNSLSKIVNFKLNVEDINDNSPSFTESSYRYEISESSSVSMSLHLPRATDDDSPAYSISHYAMKRGSIAAEYFRVDQVNVHQRHSGRKSELQPLLTLTEILDRENISSFSFILQALDTKNNIGETMIKIDILDSNDNSPKWVGTPYRKNISECTTSNQEIFTLLAEDRDAGKNGVVNYKISDRATDFVKQLFYINSNKLYLSGKLDYDDKKTRRIEIPVLAVDGGSLQAETVVELDVQDCNDNKPVIKVIYMGQNVPRLAHIVENESKMKSLAIIQVSDKDSGKSGDVNCRLNNQNFQLNVVPRSSTNKIYYFVKKENVKFDREQGSRITVTITCFDNGDNSHESQERLHIQIDDVNDNAPEFYGESEFRFSENRQPNVVIGQIKARDIDAASDIEFAIFPTRMRDYFAIEKSGSLLSRTRFDRERQDTYVFTVRASDTGTPVQQSEKNITVHILDENDNPPKYIGDHDFYIPESDGSSSVQYFLGNLNASDDDINQNSMIVFEIDRHTDPTYKHSYRIQNNNRLYASGILDRETSPIHLVPVVIRDQGSPVLSTTITLTIHLLDVNDNAPQFSFPIHSNNRVNISHGTTVGTTITTIIAKDPDKEENGTVSYTLSSSMSQYFTLQSNGLLILKQSLPRATKRYTLHIIAKDGGLIKSLSNSTYLYVYTLPYHQDSAGPHKGRFNKDTKKYDSGDSNPYQQENNLTILLCLAAAVIIVFLIVLAAFAYIYIRGDPFCSEILGSRNDRYSSDDENAEATKHLRHPTLRDDPSDRGSDGQNTGKLLKQNTLENSRYVTAHDRLGTFCRSDPQYSTKSKTGQFIGGEGGLDSYYRELLPINSSEEVKEVDLACTLYTKGLRKESDTKNKALLYEVSLGSDPVSQFKAVNPALDMPDYQVYSKAEFNHSKNAYNELTKISTDGQFGGKAPVNIHFYDTYSKKSQSASSTPVLARPPKITSSFV